MPRPISLVGCALLVLTIAAEMVMYFHRANDRAASFTGVAAYPQSLAPSSHPAFPEPGQSAPVAQGKLPGDFPGAASDPSAELAAAMREPDPETRRSRLQAVVRAWAASEPDAAFQWALHQNAGWREEAVLAALAGAAAHPDRAVELANSWLREDAGLSLERGAKIVKAWGTDNHGSLALALSRAAGKEAEENWLPLLFSIWASKQPDQALEALREISDPALRANAQNALIQSWPPTQFPALADYALSLPAGGETRGKAITRALEGWGMQDPTALGAWLNERPASEEFDAGMAFLATKTDGLNRPPSVAITWAEAINDPVLRLSCVTHVVNEWRAVDPAAARRYVREAAGLSPQERSQLLGETAGAGK